VRARWHLVLRIWHSTMQYCIGFNPLGMKHRTVLYDTRCGCRYPWSNDERASRSPMRRAPPRAASNRCTQRGQRTVGKPETSLHGQWQCSCVSPTLQCVTGQREMQNGNCMRSCSGVQFMVANVCWEHLSLSPPICKWTAWLDQRRRASPPSLSVGFTSHCFVGLIDSTPSPRTPELIRD
jgi:hypothetical protein